MMEKGNEQEKKHTLSMDARRHISISGVCEVESFDEQTVVLSTVCGEMAIEGSTLHIHVLSMDQGIVTLDGRIDSVTYYERESSGKGEKQGFFGRLFH